MRHIALAGMSFCGSTVMSYILGSLPGCSNIGESHWLTEKTKAGLEIFCAHCGTKCEILNAELRGALQHDAKNWYAKIAQKIQTNLLISSDKAPALLDRLDPTRSYDLVVLYKPPELHARSYARIMHRDGVAFEFKRYLDQWASFYEKYLNRFEVEGRKIFIDAENFYRQPHRSLNQLCEALDLPFAPGALRYWEKIHHAMGGNFNPYTRLQTDPDSLPVVPLRRHPLGDALLAEINAHERSREVLELLSNVPPGITQPLHVDHQCC